MSFDLPLNGGEIELPEPKFHIGESVCSKNTGLPALGKVLGVIHARAYIALTNIQIREWSTLYTDWPDKYVYMVVFNEPQKIMSIKEFSDKHEDLKGENLRAVYDHTIPKSNLICYPEDDLEDFDAI